MINSTVIFYHRHCFFRAEERQSTRGLDDSESAEEDVDEALTNNKRSEVDGQTEDESLSRAIADAKKGSENRIKDMDLEHKQFKEKLQKEKDMRKVDFVKAKENLHELSKRGHEAIDKLSKEETERYNEKMKMYKSMK